ncbi:hypothetical protein SLEP1_g21122 [Rubroshorea leprosula]|uniref:Ribulose bisphosphate carboxylase/oxygenase activase AAA helical domain-containing protein n=1 Tax=Rubroshorea leprosula TaxID=152421 RepID=A0AAV5J855_9ROSI|nr:hypothetical protein SLEP1_g21122 [Rubroshorea leprosula]
MDIVLMEFLNNLCMFIVFYFSIQWVEDIGGVESLGNKLLKRGKNEKLPVFTPPKQTVEALLESGYSLLREQQLIMETKLSKEYMKNIDD